MSVEVSDVPSPDNFIQFIDDNMQDAANNVDARSNLQQVEYIQQTQVEYVQQAPVTFAASLPLSRIAATDNFDLDLQTFDNEHFLQISKNKPSIAAKSSTLFAQGSREPSIAAKSST